MSRGHMLTIHNIESMKCVVVVISEENISIPSIKVVRRRLKQKEVITD